MAYQVGDRVGDYEVIGILGAGGMGAVYQVRNVISNRVEAMKILLPELTSNQDVADRFLREIRVLGSLEHPNIAALRTAQRVDNQILMIMECIEGLSLDALLKRGRIPREHQLSIVAQVLSALDFAHQRGIIHRDIKPSNIMVNPSGQVKLMDFGIAKLTADRKLTATGSTLGSVYYMSPEQIQGADNVDARSDIYALGICLYEMTTGKRPFDAPSEYSLMSAHLHDAPRAPVQLDPTIPEPLNQIILMSIAKDPAQRFQSAGAMLSAVNSVRGQLGDPVMAQPDAPAERPSPSAAGARATSSPSLPKSRRGIYMALGSLVTAGVVVAALWWGPKYFQTGAATPSRKSAVEPPSAAAAGAVVPPATLPAVAPSPAVLTPDSSQPATVLKSQAAAPEIHRSAGGTTPVRERVAIVPAAPQSTAAPLSQPPSPQSASQQIAEPQQARPEPNPAAVSNAAALNEAREQYNQLAIRAGTAKSGLQSLQNQMGGRGLRGDMKESAVRMDVLMNEAMASIRAGDLERARRNLDMADRTIEKIEKFLGR